MPQFYPLLFCNCSTRGEEIDPEDFSEFESAYDSFTETNKFIGDTQIAIENALKPLIYLEGVTDQKYVERASKLLGRQHVIANVDIKGAGGFGTLNNIWKTPLLPDALPQKVFLLYDCDRKIELEEKGKFSRQGIPFQDGNPIVKGIENLFSKQTIEKARAHKDAFIDIQESYNKTIRGKSEEVPEVWTVNEEEKDNLCNWLCENGTTEDFQPFETVLEMIEALLENSGPATEVAG